MAKNPQNVDIALEYLEHALANITEVKDNMKRVEKFAINILKADYLILKGEVNKGQKLKLETLETAKGFDMYYYGLNTLIVKGNKKEAFRLLSENIKKNPKQWQAYLAMGEYYLKDENQEKATKNFKMSFELAPDNWKNYARYLYLQNKLILDQKK